MSDDHDDSIFDDVLEISGGPSALALAIITTGIVLVVMFVSGCCSVAQTRCSGNVAEICDSRGIWRQMQDCDETEGERPFTCQGTMLDGNEEFTCLPAVVEEEFTPGETEVTLENSDGDV